MIQIVASQTVKYKTGPEGSYPAVLLSFLLFIVLGFVRGSVVLCFILGIWSTYTHRITCHGTFAQLVSYYSTYNGTYTSANRSKCGTCSAAGKSPANVAAASAEFVSPPPLFRLFSPTDHHSLIVIGNNCFFCRAVPGRIFSLSARFYVNGNIPFSSRANKSFV
jgi:hypothetical protein